jgi:hypothetical protein
MLPSSRSVDAPLVQSPGRTALAASRILLTSGRSVNPVKRCSRKLNPPNSLALTRNPSVGCGLRGRREVKSCRRPQGTFRFQMSPSHRCDYTLAQEAILGIDAAWTNQQPSGVALMVGTNGRWRSVAVAPSYEAFLDLCGRTQVNWDARHMGSVPDPAALVQTASTAAQLAETSPFATLFLDPP